MIFFFCSIKLPDKITRSLTVRPLFSKICLRVVKLENGDGILPVTSDDRETVPSLLPVKTGHSCRFLNYIGIHRN